LLHIPDGDRGIDRTDVDHPSTLESVEPDVPFYRLRLIESEDEPAVRDRQSFGSVAKLCDLPYLPFVLSEVLDGGRLEVRDRQQTPYRMNSEAAEVCCDPAAA